MPETTTETQGLIPLRTITSPDTPQIPIRKALVPIKKPSSKGIESLKPCSNTSLERNIVSPEALKHLNKRQIAFINYYCAGNNAYRAAEKAGYSEGTCINATQLLLNNPHIREEIARRWNEDFKEANIKNEDIFASAARMAMANIFDYIKIEEGGKWDLDLGKIPRELGFAIQEMSYDAQGRPRIRLVDKKAVLELIAKFRGMGTDKLEISGKGGAPLTVQSIDQMVQQHVQQQNVQQNITINVGSQGALPQGDSQARPNQVLPALPDGASEAI